LSGHVPLPIVSIAGGSSLSLRKPVSVLYSEKRNDHERPGARDSTLHHQTTDRIQRKTGEISAGVRRPGYSSSRQGCAPLLATKREGRAFLRRKDPCRRRPTVGLEGILAKLRKRSAGPAAAHETGQPLSTRSRGGSTFTLDHPVSGRCRVPRA